MSSIRRLLEFRVSSEKFDVRLGQGLCFAAAPFAVAATALGIARLPLTEGEIVLTLLGGLALALQLVMLGMVMPLASAAK